MWSSHKQKKIRRSWYGAEIPAAADADNCGYFMKEMLHAILPGRELGNELLVDSKSLFETITTLHQSGDYRLCKVVACMRDWFESKELIVVRWISGSQNFADVLSKKNIALSKRLNYLLKDEDWNIDLTSSAN